MNNTDLINGYCEHMEWRRLSRTTVSIRCTYLTKLSRDLGPFKDIKPKVLRAWLADPERKLEASSQAVLLTTIHGFYLWAQKNKKLKKDPTVRIDKPRVAKGFPHPISEDDLAKALANADALMRCWLTLGAYSGCRCQEIALMSREDIDEERMRLHIVHGKGAKQRWVPLSSKLLSALHEWGIPSTGRLWEVTPAQMSKMLSAYLHDQGINASAHSLRHRFASQIYQHTKDILKVKNLLGHESVATTQIYAAANMDDAGEDIENL